MSWTAPTRYELGPVARLGSVLLLLLPTALLTAAAAHLDSRDLAVGAGIQAIFALLLCRQQPVWRPPVSASVIVLYLVALGWAWLPTRGVDDGFLHLVHGVLLVAAVVLLIAHDLVRTGAEPLRRANRVCRRLVARRDWPAALADCRTLPEVAALRDAVRDDPRPAIELLDAPRPAVVAAALGALEYRPLWRPGEAERVLSAAARAVDPGVRVAAAYALAGVDTAELVAGLAEFLRDPAPEVRKAAADALLWDGDRRWPLAREAVRQALAAPKAADDGPLVAASARLPAAAVCDLTAWAGEHPPLSRRAIQTLVEQYNRALLDGTRPDLAIELSRQVLDPVSPPGLRVELAALLRDHRMLTPDLLDRLTNVDQPGPMRLLAAEAMLRADPNDPDGMDVLRGLARQPNREMALSVGGVLQHVLGFELGLPAGDLPAPQTKVAAEVARRVLQWANGASPDDLRPKTPGPRPGLGSRPPFPGLQPTAFVPHPGGKSPRA